MAKVESVTFYFKINGSIFFIPQQNLLKWQRVGLLVKEQQRKPHVFPPSEGEILMMRDYTNYLSVFVVL